jgi:hypothetical protein
MAGTPGTECSGEWMLPGDETLGDQRLRCGLSLGFVKLGFERDGAVDLRLANAAASPPWRRLPLSAREAEQIRGFGGRMESSADQMRIAVTRTGLGKGRGSAGTYRQPSKR